jgi:hypothetical protein
LKPETHKYDKECDTKSLEAYSENVITAPSLAFKNPFYASLLTEFNGKNKYS